MTNIVSPSLLSCDFLNIETELNSFKNENLWFHLDIMDGHFVPNLTFGHPIISKIAKKTDIPLDAHFMVTNPEFYLETLKEIKLHNFTFHYEATETPLELIHNLKKHFPSAGISIKPNTKFNELSDDILQSIDLLLIMSVEPGFGGQKFIEETYEKITQAKAYREKHNLNFQIQIDGGVNNDNARKLRKAGADNLVAGSFVFKNGPTTYEEKIRQLR